MRSDPEYIHSPVPIKLNVIEEWDPVTAKEWNGMGWGGDSGRRSGVGAGAWGKILTTAIKHGPRMNPGGGDNFGRTRTP